MFRRTFLKSVYFGAAGAAIGCGPVSSAVQSILPTVVEPPLPRMIDEHFHCSINRRGIYMVELWGSHMQSESVGAEILVDGHSLQAYQSLGDNETPGARHEPRMFCMNTGGVFLDAETEVTVWSLGDPTCIAFPSVRVVRVGDV